MAHAVNQPSANRTGSLKDQTLHDNNREERRSPLLQDSYYLHTSANEIATPPLFVAFKDKKSFHQPHQISVTSSDNTTRLANNHHSFETEKNDKVNKLDFNLENSKAINFTGDGTLNGNIDIGSQSDSIVKSKLKGITSVEHKSNHQRNSSPQQKSRVISEGASASPSLAFPFKPDHQNSVKTPPKGPSTPSTTPPRLPSSSSSKMSASLRRKARFAASQNEANIQNQQQPPERRRNFAFMKSSSASSSPRRRRISNATLEKTRAHSKKLAKIASVSQNTGAADVFNADIHDDTNGHFDAKFEQKEYNFDAQFSNNDRYDSGQQHQHQHRHPQSFPSNHQNATTNNPYEFAMQQEVAAPSPMIAQEVYQQQAPPPSKLNFAAFETDSCISANTSVYDMDFIDQMPSFDDTASSTSFFSNASTSVFSAVSNSSGNLGGAYGNNNIRPMKQQIPIHAHHQQPQQNWGKSKNKLDMYSGVGNNNRQMRHNNLIRGNDEFSSPQHHPHHQQYQNTQDFNNNINNNLNKSNLSTVSSGSSISGAAARRLMRRGLSQHISQSSLGSSTNNNHGGSVGSANSGKSDGSTQYSAFETPQKGNESSSIHQSNFNPQQQQTMSKSRPNPSRNDDRPPLSPVPFLHESAARPKSSHRKSNGRTSSKKKNIHIETTGFTFDAFGLDANEINNEVNEAMKELADSDLDLSLFAMGANGEDNYSTSSGSSSVIARKNQKQQKQQKELIELMNNNLATSSSTSSSKRGVVSVSSSGGGSVQSSEEKKGSMSALRDKFKTAHLPDITTDNASVGATNDNGDFDLSSVLALSDEFMSKPTDVGKRGFNPTWEPDFDKQDLSYVEPETGSNHGEELEEDECGVIAKNESMSSSDSGELQQFQARKAVGTFQPQSESQKRAREWASQRTAPILVSPLLVPKKITVGKEKRSTSHKRAKEWAEEAPRQANVHEVSPPRITHETQTQCTSPLGTDPVHKRKEFEEKWSEIPSSSSKEQVSMDNKSHIQRSKQRQRPPIQVQVLPPVENVTLRKTGSPDNEGGVDYEKFKSSAPTVSLRKVDPPRPNKQTNQSNSFLSNVKLRKTNSPIPQNEPVHEDFDYSEDTHENSNTQFTESDNDQTFLKQIQDELIPEDNVQESLPQKPKLTYREQRELQLREKEAKTQSEPVMEQKPPNVEAMIRKRIAANKQNLKVKSNINEETEKKDEVDISSLRNKLRPPSPREPEVAHPTQSPPSSRSVDFRASLQPVTNKRVEAKEYEIIDENHKSNSTIIMNQDVVGKIEVVETPESEIIQNPTDERDEQEADLTNLDKQITENSVAALFDKRSSLMNAIQQKSKATENEADESDRPSSNRSALMNAIQQKSKSRENEADESDSPSINNVSALFAKRAEAIQKPIVSKERDKEYSNISEQDGNVEPEEPSINNVAALFQKRAEMMNGSSELVKKPKEKQVDDNDELNESSDSLVEGSNSKLLQMLANKSEATKHRATMSQNNEMITLGETAGKEKETSEKTLNVSLKDDPAYTKYFKMLKMGLPMEVVKHAMTRDGLDASLMDGDHRKSADSSDSDVPLKEDPKYAKYFKMLKMGLPMGAVKNAMERDGENPSVIDGDHNLPAASSNSKQKGSKSSTPLPKDKYRRTRLHWDTLRQVRSTSVWAQINQDPDVEQIEIDENEFAELFQSELGSRDITKDTDSSKKRNAVKVIDPKRANNGGIILARLKITYEEMAVAIDRIDETAMSLEQMQGIIEYIPNKEEKIALRKYMTSSDKDSVDAFDELCECEKFMVAMMTVKHSKEKVRAILFKQQFKQCMDELGQDVRLVEKSCEELRSSERLRKLLGIVLNIGNRLNTAGPTRKGKAGAFTIESLLKLSQAKAFDKKTTFLQYIVMVVKRNNESLIKFKNDLPSVLKADKIYWDQCESDLEEVENQLENVRKIALHEVYGKNRPAWARQKKGKDDDDMSQESMSLEAEVEALRSTKIGVFTLHAIKIVSSLREHVEKTKAKFFKLLEYFGEEDKKKMHPHQLFEIIVTFSRDFDAALDEIGRIEKKKKIAEQKKNGTRTNSPSNRSKDSNSRDEESSSQSPSPKNINIQHHHSKPSKALRISSHQPHILSKPKEVAMVKPKPQELQSRPVNDSKSSIVEYTMEEPEQINPASPQQQYYDDCDSRENSEFSNEKNHTNKTMATSETSTSDSDSQEHPIIITESDNSKEGCDENAVPSNFSNQAVNQHVHQIRTSRVATEAAEESFGQNIISSSQHHENVQTHSSPKNDLRSEKMEVPTSVRTRTKHSDQSSTRLSLNKQSMREKARAMRHQRVASQRSSSRTSTSQHHSPIKSNRGTAEVNYVYTNTSTPPHQNHSSTPSEKYRTYNNSPSCEPRQHHNNNGHLVEQQQQTRRRKPPSPEDMRPRQTPTSPAPVSSSPSRSASSPSISAAQQRIRARRERIERRRRIET